MGCTLAQMAKLGSIRQRLQDETQKLIEVGGTEQDGVSKAYVKAQAARLKAEGEAVKQLSLPQRQVLTQIQSEFPRLESLGASTYRVLAVTRITPDQSNRLKALSEATGKRRQEIVTRAKSEAERKQVLTRMRALESETAAAIKKLLAPEQQTQFDQALTLAPPAASR